MVVLGRCGQSPFAGRKRGKIGGETTRMNRATVICSLLVATILAGCGYHVVGRNDSLPKTVHVIAVPAIENKTSSYRIEQRLTAATIHELLSRTNYKVVSVPESGDAVLRGKVLTVEAVPLLFTSIPATATTPSTTRATTMLVTMKCDVMLTESTTQKILYHNDNFVFRNEYEISTDVKSFFEEEDPALDRMAQDFAKRLVSAVTENY
jgi:outer membrane lipopolysaccharide assembly protein LptE/RlpB